jgi:hypothetical protein
MFIKYGFRKVTGAPLAVFLMLEAIVAMIYSGSLNKLGMTPLYAPVAPLLFAGTMSLVFGGIALFAAIKPQPDLTATFLWNFGALGAGMLAIFGLVPIIISSASPGLGNLPANLEPLLWVATMLLVVASVTAAAAMSAHVEKIANGAAKHSIVLRWIFFAIPVALISGAATQEFVLCLSLSAIQLCCYTILAFTEKVGAQATPCQAAA